MNIAFSQSVKSKGDVFELGPRSKSRNSLDFSRPQRSAYSGKSGFVWPFHKSGSLESTSKVSLDRQSSHSSQNGASQFRVVGRGGSGSKLRQISLSNPVVVVEADSAASRSKTLDQGATFYRPGGRGGLGSLSTNPPTNRTLKPMKPPTALIGLIRGRKRSELRLDEEFESHRNSPPRRAQSVYYRSRSSSFEEGPSTSVSPDPDYDDTNPIIEEVSRQRTNDRRERSMNKLTRTLGAHPSTILEDRHHHHHHSQKTTGKSPIFDNFSTTGERIIIVGKTTRTHHQWDSFENDSIMENDTLTSPMTFAPGSTENRDSTLTMPRTPTPHTTASSDIDSSFSTREDDSVQSHSSSIQVPDLVIEPHTSSSSSSSPSSRMPQLHVSTHSDAVISTSGDGPYDDEDASDLTNGPVTKSDWLVPLNELVISISSRRAAPSKNQSWTGEWNREMKDVIRDLRRL